MPANATPQKDKIRWEQPGVDIRYARLPFRGQSRFGTYEIVGIGMGLYDVHFTPHGGKKVVLARGVSALRAYYACPKHNKKLLGIAASSAGVNPADSAYPLSLSGWGSIPPERH